jgi:hypothetical protein
LGGDARCGLALLDLSSDGVDIVIERPRGLVSHNLAAIKGPSSAMETSCTSLLMGPPKCKP